MELNAKYLITGITRKFQSHSVPDFVIGTFFLVIGIVCFMAQITSLYFPEEEMRSVNSLNLAYLAPHCAM